MSPFLSLRPEGEGADVRLLFHHQPTGSARVLSGTAVHVLAIATLLLVARLLPDRFYEAVLPQDLPEKLVYLIQPGPGGGGGGGNRSPEPPPPAKLKGPDEITVPTLSPPEPTLEVVDIEPPPAAPAIAEPMAGATQDAAGAPLGIGRNGDSRGPGDSGVGTEKGPLQPGTRGGPSQPGNGVLPPRLLRKVD